MSDDLIGRRYGTRVILATLGRNERDDTLVRTICDCGHVGEQTWRVLQRGRRCSACSVRDAAAVRRDATLERWRKRIGKRVGRRTLLEVGRNERGQIELTTQCGCGATTVSEVHVAKRARKCRECLDRSREEPQPTTPIEWLLSATARACPDVWRSDTPESVEAVAELVALLGRPMTNAEASMVLGVTRQRVQQIEDVARRKLARNREARELAAEVEPRDEGSWSTWSDSAEASAGRGW